MTTNTATASHRKTMFSRTLVLTALFVVAAAGSILCVRSARADVPGAPAKEGVSVEAQAAASALAAQSIANPALGASFMQVLWGGGKTDEPPKILPPYTTHTNGARHRARSREITPRERKPASAKSE